MSKSLTAKIKHCIKLIFYCNVNDHLKYFLLIIKQSMKYDYTEVFNQVGYIINMFVPELYKSDIFKNEHIISTFDDCAESVAGFEKYTKLCNIRMNNLLFDFLQKINPKVIILMYNQIIKSILVIVILLSFNYF
jgi:hypothetical protein